MSAFSLAVALCLLADAPPAPPPPAPAAAAPSKAKFDVPSAGNIRVLETGAFVYSEPDSRSAVLRRLYLGELLTGGGEVSSPDGTVWVAVTLGEEMNGYVRKDKVGSPHASPVKKWEPAYLVRDERPFVLGARFGGETLGVGINFRYQPFTRVGVSLSTGVLIDPVTARSAVGPTIAFGVYSAFLLFNISPIIEAGVMHATYTARNVSLNIFSLYASMGAEWMLDNGFFIHVYATYVRSIGISVSVPLETLRGAPLERPNFGWLDTYAEVGSALNLIMPGFALGYAF